jgi:hypothetical protein
VLAEDAHLFTILPTTQRSRGRSEQRLSLRATPLQTPNDPDGMAIYYYSKTAGTAPVAVTVSDASGREVARLSGPSAAGINRVVWSTRVGGGGGRGGVGAAAGRGGRGGAGPDAGRPRAQQPKRKRPPARGAANANPLDQWMPLGEYKVTLDVGGKTFTPAGAHHEDDRWGLNGATPQVIRR